MAALNAYDMGTVGVIATDVSQIMLVSICVIFQNTGTHVASATKFRIIVRIKQPSINTG